MKYLKFNTEANLISIFHENLPSYYVVARWYWAVWLQTSTQLNARLPIALPCDLQHDLKYVRAAPNTGILYRDKASPKKLEPIIRARKARILSYTFADNNLNTSISQCSDVMDVWFCFSFIFETVRICIFVFDRIVFGSVFGTWNRKYRRTELTTSPHWLNDAAVGIVIG